MALVAFVGGDGAAGLGDGATGLAGLCAVLRSPLALILGGAHRLISSTVSAGTVTLM